ncbi:MAG: WcbI family polysaccharide biosynthesis putative acetyltransferase, partial [Janthinobacterium lividum]
MTDSRKDQSRREHYGIFYGIHPLPPEDGRPLVLVHGNCQAESVRVLLSAAGSGVRTVRVPPAHELVTDDLTHLQRLLAQVDLLVSQPVRDDYRGLPLGTRQLRDAAPAAARVVIFPVIRWAALHPFQVIVRSPEAGEPPIVPYHDLRTLSLVAGGAGAMPVLPAPTAVRAVREHSLGQLRERQQRHGAIDVTDLLLAAGRGACQVIN